MSTNDVLMHESPRKPPVQQEECVKNGVVGRNAHETPSLRPLSRRFLLLKNLLSKDLSPEGEQLKRTYHPNITLHQAS
jgi:hypothetical protein